MNNKILFLAIIAFFFSCNSGTKTENEKNSPDLFGWTVKNILQLKSECLERYGKEGEKSEMQKENYCNCFVEKIIFSVKYDRHLAPDEETIKMYENFSQACEDLTTESN